MSDELLSREREQEIRALEAGATAGPWVVSTADRGFEPGRYVIQGGRHGAILLRSGGLGVSDDERIKNSAFIADARRAVPELLADRDTLRAMLRDVVSAAQDSWMWVRTVESTDQSQQDELTEILTRLMDVSYRARTLLGDYDGDEEGDL